MEHILEGRSQDQIAQALGISQPAVSKIVRRIEERLLADVAWKIERQRARHSMRLEFLYAEAVRAWKASQQEGLRKRQRKTDGVGRVGTMIAEIVSEPRHGDPRYLAEARGALTDLRTLWGIDAPDHLAIDTSPYAGWTDAALDAELVRHARLLQRTGDGARPTPSSTPHEEEPDALAPST
jgi:hypothetical protein